MTDKIEMLTNRIKTALFMQRTPKKKAKGALGKRENGRDSFCFIGQMCVAMNIEKTKTKAYLYHGREENYFEYSFGQKGETGEAPDELSEALGLLSETGEFSLFDPKKDDYRTLGAFIEEKSGISLRGSSRNLGSIVDLNDSTEMTVRTMGKILGTMVCGGPGTPFTKIEVTPEEFEKAYAKALEDPMFVEELKP